MAVECRSLWLVNDGLDGRRSRADPEGRARLSIRCHHQDLILHAIPSDAIGTVKWSPAASRESFASLRRGNVEDVRCHGDEGIGPAHDGRQQASGSEEIPEAENVEHPDIDCSWPVVPIFVVARLVILIFLLVSFFVVDFVKRDDVDVVEALLVQEVA